MKKILMGLLAVSATVFSAIDMANPVDETNVFEPSQTGKIKVTMDIKSRVTPVKYVVFANTTDSYTGSESELNLPDVLLSQIALQNQIDGTAPNVYVRKVNGGETDAEALSGVAVDFTLNFDDMYTDITNRKVSNGGKVAVVPTALMSNAELTAIVQASGFTVNTKGEIEKTGKFYRTPNNVEFYSDAVGVLKVKMSTNAEFNTNPLDSGDIATVEGLFNPKKPFAALTISAYVR